MRNYKLINENKTLKFDTLEEMTEYINNNLQQESLTLRVVPKIRVNKDVYVLINVETNEEQTFKTMADVTEHLKVPTHVGIKLLSISECKSTIPRSNTRDKELYKQYNLKRMFKE